MLSALISLWNLGTKPLFHQKLATTTIFFIFEQLSSRLHTAAHISYMPGSLFKGSFCSLNNKTFNQENLPIVGF